MNLKNNYNFQKIKNIILFIFDFKCYLCGHFSLANHVHHLDRNHANNDAFNFICLCQNCHKLIHRSVMINQVILSDSQIMQLNVLNKLMKNDSDISLDKVK